MEILPLISFTTGVISVLSPCILPVLPVFLGVSLKFETRNLVSFVLGFISIFAAVIVLTGFFTSIIYSYIAYVRLIAAVILLTVGVMMLFDYSISLTTPMPKSESSFFLGLLTSIAWAPCYSGYLISLIALLVSSNNSTYAIFNLVLYCMGFALTLIVLSYLISKIDLEKLISKTSHVPKIFAVLIIFGAVYLFLDSVMVLV
jgi:cytochrome c-type biogenesis protein